MTTLQLFLRSIKKLLKVNRFWSQHTKQLLSINSMDEFLKYVDTTKPDTFLFYKNKSADKRKDFNSVIEYLKIDLNGQSFLDIGPAYGDSLDICFEHGAKSIDYIEIDPFFFTFNKFKPLTKGYNINHFRRLNSLEHGKYSLIWVKGAFSADRFIKLKLVLSLSEWLANLELLAAPEAKIIICPHWVNYQNERKIKDVHHNYFTRMMLKKGYEILPTLKNHNHEPDYPITFYKDFAK